MDRQAEDDSDDEQFGDDERARDYGHLTGFRESPDDAMANYARGLIEQVNRGGQPDEDEEMAEEEPLGRSRLGR
ncbi:hypothetical protein [Pseudarthrobacter phenanthrenivorans]|uniref:hypothetical protein n=1 Tax=Pseudarthrobacter phenanthrenivorans TaxID=361575 RepID=UPI0016021F4C|nr:hypothetical protein [Pseudarthrobacter phenanthrenivorans]